MTTIEQDVQVGKATDLGHDPAGGPWVTVCLKHSTVHNSKSRDQARAAAKNTASFCEDCRDSGSQEFEPEPISGDGQERFDPEVQEIYHLGDGQDQRDGHDGHDGQGQHMTLDNVAQLVVEHAPEVTQKPVLGTFRAGDSSVAHNAVAVQGLYFTAACGPSMLMGESADQTDPDMCTYCLSGITAPVVPKVKIRKIATPHEPKVARVKKVVSPPEPEPEPRYSTETSDLYDAAHNLLDRLETQASLPDARRATEILEPVLTMLKAMLPRRSVGRPTGARSGLVKQSATVNPSEELGKVQVYADSGDKRAKDILEHVKAYVPGSDCGYCLARGRSTRHGYATAFCSIGRELRAMELRAASGVGL